MVKQTSQKEKVIEELMEEARKQPLTIKGLERTIKLCGIVLSLISYDLK